MGPTRSGPTRPGDSGKVCCVGRKRGSSSKGMIVRRFISALVALAFGLSLGLPLGPAQGAVSYADMPCHAEPLPAVKP